MTLKDLSMVCGDGHGRNDHYEYCCRRAKNKQMPTIMCFINQFIDNRATGRVLRMLFIVRGTSICILQCYNGGLKGDRCVESCQILTMMMLESQRVPNT